jgi:type IV pilus assembly protein PilZ
MAKNSKKSSAQGDENRVSGERIPVNILVDYKSKGTYLFDFCRDLGAGGVFIATDKPSAVGEELELSFTIPDAKKTLSVKGKVTWIQSKIETKPQVSPGMGVQFQEFSSEQRKMLEEFVARYAALVKKPA